MPQKQKSNIIRIVGQNKGGGARLHCYQLNQALAAADCNTTTYIPKPTFIDPYTFEKTGTCTYVNTINPITISKNIFTRRSKTRYIHSHLRNANIEAHFISRAARIPHIITVHTPFPAATTTKELLFRSTMRQALRACTHTIFISEFIKERIIKQINIDENTFNHSVIYNGSEAAELSDQMIYRTGDRINICLVGELTERKGIADLKAVVSQLAASRDWDKFTLSVYGQGPLQYLVKALQSQYDNINYRGYCVEQNLIYAKQHLNLSLARDEAFGRVVTEAMSRGIPTIAYSSGAYPELIKSGHNGYLSKSVDELVNTLSNLCKSPERLNSLAEGCRSEFQRRFSAERFCCETLSTIEHAISRLPNHGS